MISCHSAGLKIWQDAKKYLNCRKSAQLAFSPWGDHNSPNHAVNSRVLNLPCVQLKQTLWVPLERYPLWHLLVPADLSLIMQDNMHGYFVAMFKRVKRVLASSANSSLGINGSYSYVLVALVHQELYGLDWPHRSKARTIHHGPYSFL